MIESMESECHGLYQKLSNPEFYKSNGGRVAEAKSKIETMEHDIADAYERWALLERILKEQRQGLLPWFFLFCLFKRMGHQ